VHGRVLQGEEASWPMPHAFYSVRLWKSTRVEIDQQLGVVTWDSRNDYVRCPSAVPADRRPGSGARMPEKASA
jgi:hypothetical protein